MTSSRKSNKARQRQQQPKLTNKAELIIDSASGDVRQAGADGPGRFVDEFKTIAERSLFAFAKGVLGYNLLNRTFHLPALERIQRVPPFRKLELWPRGHLKTTTTKALLVHLLIQPDGANCYFPDGIGHLGHSQGTSTRILLASKTAKLAQSTLAEIMMIFETNQLLRALWPQCIWENPRRDARSWNAERLVLPRKFITKEASIETVGVGGQITGYHFDVHDFDDLIDIEDANSPTTMATVIEWFRASRALMNDQRRSLEFITGCLPADARVLLENGTTRPIVEIAPGDRVWATDTDGVLSVRRVEAVLPQGVADTLTVSTAVRALRATPNHPFLVRRKRDLAWVRAEKLRRDDFLVAVKEVPGTLLHPWMTEEFCWLFGFLFGDGWISTRERRGYLCVAKSDDDALNARVCLLIREWFSPVALYETPFGYYRLDSVCVAEGLHLLGFAGTAKTKRLPEWTFALPPTHRRALLRGLCEADGCRDKKAIDMWTLELTNRGLVEDARQLASLCGVRTGGLRSRHRVLHPPCSPEPVRSPSWATSLNFATAARSEVYVGAFQHDVSSGLRQERIVAVTRNAVAEPVYDLTVEGTPAFFANGLAVHNTRWAVHDLYEYIERNDPTVEVTTRRLLEDGKLIFPEGFSMDMVPKLQREFGTLFPLLYMNSAADPSLVDFDMSLARTFRVEDECIIFDETPEDVMLAERQAETANRTGGEGTKPPLRETARRSGAYDAVAARQDYFLTRHGRAS